MAIHHLLSIIYFHILYVTQSGQPQHTTTIVHGINANSINLHAYLTRFIIPPELPSGNLLHSY